MNFVHWAMWADCIFLVKEDGCSFIHFSIHRNTGQPDIIAKVPVFKTFSAPLTAEGLFTQPQAIKLDMVGESFDL